MWYKNPSEFAPLGSKFYPFIVDPFHTGGHTMSTELLPLTVHPFPLTILYVKCNNL